MDHGGSEDSRAKIEGVAIILPDFLKLLDKYGIPHDDESNIRCSLRQKARLSGRYLTHHRQYFLQSGSKDSFISRRSSCFNATCCGCVIFPKSDMSPSMLTVLAEVCEGKTISNSCIHLCSSPQYYRHLVMAFFTVNTSCAHTHTHTHTHTYYLHTFPTACLRRKGGK